jgi:uncharacterized protein (DUF169 family)
MNFDELSSKLRKTLVLEDSPVGVKLIRVGEDLSEIAEQAQPMQYCASVLRARKGETVILGKDNHACILGGAVLGIINIPDKISSGEPHFKTGLFSSPAAASKTITEIPKIAPETMRATLVFPLEKAPVEPEVILLEVKPRQALWIALALNYNKGGRLSCSFAGVGCTCGDATVIPYLRNTPNFTIGDFGGRMLRGPEFMIMGLPATLLEEVANNLEKLGCPR